jgi:hypothetical protein
MEDLQARAKLSSRFWIFGGKRRFGEYARQQSLCLF